MLSLGCLVGRPTTEIAHEALHQLYSFAKVDFNFNAFFSANGSGNFRLDENKLDTHDNSRQNLNMDGKYINLPKKYSKKVRPSAEQILPNQLSLIQTYLNKYNPK